MSAPPAKRARASTNEAVISPLHDPEKYLSVLENFNRATVDRLLCAAALKHADVAGLIDTAFDRIAAAERKKVTNFDYLSKSAWKTLNVTYDRMSGSAQYDMAGEAESSVMECLETIKDGCPPYANFKTKESGLETLRKIGKTICLSNNGVGHEVCKTFQYDPIIEETMTGIIGGMTDAEAAALFRPGPYGVWIDKLKELESLASAYCILEGLGDVIRLLEGKSESGKREKRKEDGKGNGEEGAEDVDENNPDEDDDVFFMNERKAG